MQSDNKGAMTFGQESIADHYGNTERERHSFSKAIYESAEKGEPIPDLEIEYTNGGTRRMSIHDGVFGDITEHGPNYRNVGWIGTVALMMKTQIGLGVLGIPAVFNAMGIVPGVICLIAIGIITTWSDYMVGVFKINHPEVYGIDDVGLLIFGRVGQIIFSITFVLFWIFCAGSGMLGMSVAFNAVSTHGTCTAVFVAVAAILGFACASIRTLGRISWLAWIGVTCIISAILIVSIAVGVESKPAAAPTGPWVSDYHIVKQPSFLEAMDALGTLVFAYAGTPGFFSIISEMRDPKEYTKALAFCQSIVSACYVAIGVVVYYYCGSYVASPALGSAGPLLKKISYGVALPGLLVSTTLLTHFPAKYIFVRILRGSKHLVSNSPIHWMTWIACTFGTAMVAYIIASAIPVFGDLVSLVGALLGTLMCFQPYGAMWLYDNWHREGRRGFGWYFGVGWAFFVIISGFFLMGAGTWASVVTIKEDYAANGGSAAWGCADNSGST